MRSAKAPDDDIDAPIDVEAKSNDVDPSKVAMLVSFGYNEETASKALKASDGDIEKATYWIFNPPAASDPLDMFYLHDTVGLTSFPDYLVLHMRNLVMETDSVPKKLDVQIDVGDVIDITHMQRAKAPDDDIDDPIDAEAKSNDVDPSKVATLVSFGYNKETASKALKASDGDIEKATDWIFNPPAASDPLDMDATSNSEPTVDADLPDGDGKYKLIGLTLQITWLTSTSVRGFKDGKDVVRVDD
ncbi:ubiquitin carboxyl-terminal hydrolase 14 [Tanacetum coccineum]